MGSLNYSYDADGRVTSKSGTLGSIALPANVSGNTFNADNEMTAFNGTTLGYDNNGNLTADGTNVQPFGATTVSGPANANPYQFTGRENDATGLYFYRARYYSPTFQRFVSQDPIAFINRHSIQREFDGASSVPLPYPDPNLYSYANDAPSNYVDPLGLYWIVIRGSLWPWFLALHYPDGSTSGFPDDWGFYEIQGCPNLICIFSDQKFQQALQNYNLASGEPGPEPRSCSQ